MPSHNNEWNKEQAKEIKEIQLIQLQIAWNDFQDNFVCVCVCLEMDYACESHIFRHLLHLECIGQSV